MNIREITAQMKALAGVVREHVAKAFSDLSARIDVVENKIKLLPEISEEAIAKHAAVLALQSIPPVKDGIDGKDAEPELIKQLISEAIAELPPAQPGEPGKSVTVDDVKPLLQELIGAAVAEIPPPKDGKDVAPELIKELISEAVAELPPAQPGEPGKSFTLDDAKPLIEEIAQAAAMLIPPPQDGKSVLLEDVQRMVDEAVAKSLAKIELPKNGEPGRDAAHIEILPAISEEKSYPRGTYATHLGGLWRSYETTTGLKGWECIVDGMQEINFQKVNERKFNLQVVRSSGVVDSYDAYLPVMVYRGVFSKGEFEPGDCVTWDGSLWHCDEATSDKPGEIGSKGWRLCVKKGRDGKNGTNGRDLVKGVSLQ